MHVSGDEQQRRRAEGVGSAGLAYQDLAAELLFISHKNSVLIALAISM